MRCKALYLCTSVLRTYMQKTLKLSKFPQQLSPLCTEKAPSLFGCVYEGHISGIRAGPDVSWMFSQHFAQSSGSCSNILWAGSRASSLLSSAWPNGTQDKDIQDKHIWKWLPSCKEMLINTLFWGKSRTKLKCSKHRFEFSFGEGGDGKAVPKAEHAQHCKQQINPFSFVLPLPFNQKNHRIIKVAKDLQDHQV